MFASNPTPYAVVTAGGQIITDLTLPFLYIALLIELTPGPNMTWLALLSLQHGRGAGLAALAGVATGLAILAVVALFALTQASGIAPQWLWVLKYVGVAYLLYLAWEAWADSNKSIPEMDAEKQSAVGNFWHGLLLNIFNPKALLFYITILPNHLEPDATQTGQKLFLAGLYVALASGIHLILVLSAAHLFPLLHRGTHMRTVQRGFAVALAAVAVWIAVS